MKNTASYEYFRSLDSIYKSLLLQLLLRELTTTEQLQKSCGLSRSSTLGRMKHLINKGIVLKVNNKYNGVISYTYSLTLPSKDKINLAEAIAPKDLSLEIQVGICLVEMAKMIDEVKDRVTTLEEVV